MTDYRKTQIELTALELDDAQAKLAAIIRAHRHAMKNGRRADYTRMMSAARDLDCLTSEYQKLVGGIYVSN